MSFTSSEENLTPIIVSLARQTLYLTSGRKGSGETPIVDWFCLVSRLMTTKIIYDVRARIVARSQKILHS